MARFLIFFNKGIGYKSLMPLYLISLILSFCPSKLVAQDPKPGQETITTSDQPDENQDRPRKKKKDIDETFFLFEFDKLSSKFFARAIIDLLAIFILIRLIYFPNYRKRELFFTFFIFNFIIFLISYFLNKVDMGLGAAFGLFAVFSMLRYRTENISAKDMTYLFLTIAIGLVTAISKVSAFELGFVDSVILLFTFLLEGNWLLKKEFSKIVLYDNLEMIKTENHPALITDLKLRTGLNIHRIGIDKVDFIKDAALVKVYFFENLKQSETTDPEGIVSESNDD